jgi:hypothetical protein
VVRLEGPAKRVAAETNCEGFETVNDETFQLPEYKHLLPKHSVALVQLGI